jgi:hypothetical protein
MREAGIDISHNQTKSVSAPAPRYFSPKGPARKKGGRFFATTRQQRIREWRVQKKSNMAKLFSRLGKARFPVSRFFWPCPFQHLKRLPGCSTHCTCENGKVPMAVPLGREKKKQ